MRQQKAMDLKVRANERGLKSVAVAVDRGQEQAGLKFLEKCLPALTELQRLARTIDTGDDRGGA